MVDREETIPCLCEFTLRGDEYKILERPRIFVDQIRSEVAHFHNMTVGEMLLPRRARQFSRPRQEAMWLAKKLTRRSLPEIARALNLKDHTTVVSGLHTMNKLIEEGDVVVDNLVSLLTKFPNVLRNGVHVLPPPADETAQEDEGTPEPEVAEEQSG